jgi:hypothetical protein
MLIIEASVLLTKLLYSQGRFDEATKLLAIGKLHSRLNEHINKMRNRQMPETDSLRQLQLFAEAHSIRGLCLERRKQNKSISIANAGNLLANNEQEKQINEQEIIDSFEASSQFAIEHSIGMQKIFTSIINSSPNLQYPSSVTTSNSNSANTANINENSLTSNINSLTILNNSEENIDLINPLYEIALQKAPLMYIKRRLFYIKYNSLFFKAFYFIWFLMI